VEEPEIMNIWVELVLKDLVRYSEMLEECLRYAKTNEDVIGQHVQLTKALMYANHIKDGVEKCMDKIEDDFQIATGE
jgi:uncharacterized protein YigA (DUF484 family)